MYRDGPKAHEASFAAVLDALGPPQGERVLEIGCGPGVLLLELHRILTPGGRLVIATVAGPLALQLARARKAS